jgi:hypothetical protein
MTFVHFDFYEYYVWTILPFRSSLYDGVVACNCAIQIAAAASSMLLLSAMFSMFDGHVLDFHVII